MNIAMRRRPVSYSEGLQRITTKPWTIMEVCGGQTHSIVKFGIDELLPPAITLVHGPGCPVCVTPLELIEKAIEIASTPNVLFCSFGDMLRVPGTSKDLLAVKAAGGDVRIVYSPLDALKLAVDNPEREVVFFAVGFETTAPANAMAVYQAAAEGCPQFFPAGFPRSGASGHGSHSLLPGKPGAGLPGCRTRLRGHGILGV